ncbi:PAS domain S-box protein [Natronomonas sp.]|uniref:PAS domain S-box protein n=1 Tax=Natronomonas sp. TaxID=2184060 RepID=UPI00260212CE|nr:PAS domain S-box protein [Natronomonas sp.]
MTSEGGSSRVDIGLELPYERLLAEAPFGVLVIDTASAIRYANEALTDLLGYDREEVVGAPLTRLIPERLRSSHHEGFEAYLETGQRHLDWDNIELPVTHSEGHEIPLDIALRETPVGDERLFTGILTDASKRSRLQQELETNIDVLHELHAVTADSTMSFEQRRRAVLELGCDYLDLPYGFVTDISGPQQIVLAAVGDHELLQAGESCPIEESYCRRTVEDDGFLAVANAVEEGWDEDEAYERFGLGSYVGGKVVVDGELFGTLCFASSVPRGRPFTDGERNFVELASRWLGYEFQQRRQRRRLEHQNDRLDRFASRASHDLRNPLSVAKGRLELARDRHGDDEDLEAAATALAEAESRIEEMLEFARLGEVVTDPDPVSLREAARAAWGVIGADAATMTVSEDVSLSGDGERVERLLENLFRNAIEHCRPDVTVRLGALSGESGFYVEDDGDGIPDEERDSVFEPGYTTSEAGSGLGLAIVEEIATAHDWSVRLGESSNGGVRFEFVGTAVE